MIRRCSKLNRNYLVKVKTQENTRGTLVGFTGLVKIVGSEMMAYHYLDRVERSKGDKYIIKNRKGYELRFYLK